VRALPYCTSPVRCVIAGEGPEAERLAALAAELGLGARVELPGRVDDERLLSLYAGALAVFYAPHDEDYGYVTVEAFRSRRAMLTTADAGGVLEFVADGVNGLVCAPGSPRELAAALDRLFADRALALRLGEAGHRRVESINWDDVVSRLTARL
jgi:glycosyltransferase involved in cell wall biosynthesis